MGGGGAVLVDGGGCGTWVGPKIFGEVIWSKFLWTAVKESWP